VGFVFSRGIGLAEGWGGYCGKGYRESLFWAIIEMGSFWT
jgi:hypothetical protein